MTSPSELSTSMVLLALFLITLAGLYTLYRLRTERLGRRRDPHEGMYLAVLYGTALVACLVAVFDTFVL